MASFRAFDRYRPLVDDWEAFTETLRRPLPSCVWTNTLRTTVDRLRAWMRICDLPLHPLPWYPQAFKLPPAISTGNQLPYVAGLYHVQEEVSLLPVALLDPQPGERILDACAAPGNKTAQIAVRMQNRGTLVANDRSPYRMGPLRSTLDRLGVLNVTTTTYDAANYPPESGLFDRILADVPCSCEGTSRKHPSIVEETEAPGTLSGMQTAILRKAVQLCRPGGRIVYATCTYAPEENETVVDTILREAGTETLRVLPARLDGFDHAPGLVEWQGRTFHPSLRKTMRVWPHLNDSGGFFVAVLEKR